MNPDIVLNFIMWVSIISFGVWVIKYTVDTFSDLK